MENDFEKYYFSVVENHLNNFLVALSCKQDSSQDFENLKHDLREFYNRLFSWRFEQGEKSANLVHQKVVEGLERDKETAFNVGLEQAKQLSEITSLSDELAGALEFSLGREVFPQGVVADEKETEAYTKVKSALTKYTSWKGGKK